MPNIFQRISRQARKKAMAELHPETTTRQHVLSVRSDQPQAPASFDYAAALLPYENNIWVRKAITIISDNAAPLPLYVLRDKTERVDDHPALALLATPNSAHSHADLWRWWATDMLLGGEEGFEVVKSKSGQVAELWPRQPHIFAVLPDPQRVRYYGVKGYEIDDKLGDPYRLGPDEFMHFKFYNPRNPWRGIGVLLALKLSVQIDAFAQAWERFLFVNNARPDYAVVTPQGTTQTERDDIEKKIEQKYGGVQKAGQVIALEEGITDIKVLSWPPKDLGTLDLRMMSRDEIAGGFGVPDILMGFGNDSYDTQDKRTAAIQALYSLTVMPLLGFRDDWLTKSFQAQRLLAENEALITDYSGVPELQEEQDAEWARSREQIDRGALTINEWRTEQGLERVPWGDVAWLPANLVPITQAAAPAIGSAPAKWLRVDPRHNGHSEDVREIADLLSEAIETARELGVGSSE